MPPSVPPQRRRALKSAVREIASWPQVEHERCRACTIGSVHTVRMRHESAAEKRPEEIGRADRDPRPARHQDRRGSPRSGAAQAARPAIRAASTAQPCQAPMVTRVSADSASHSTGAAQSKAVHRLRWPSASRPRVATAVGSGASRATEPRSPWTLRGQRPCAGPFGGLRASWYRRRRTCRRSLRLFRDAKADGGWSQSGDGQRSRESRLRRRRTALRRHRRRSTT